MTAGREGVVAPARPLVAVAHLGPDPAGAGGMAAAIGALVASPLAQRYDLQVIVTYRAGSARTRVAVFARALLALARFLAGDRRPKIVHVHATVRGSFHRKVVVVAVARVAGAHVVLHVHSGAGDLEVFRRRLGPWRRRALRWALCTSDQVLAVSRASAELLESRYGAPVVVVVGNPLPCPLPADVLPPSSPTEVLYLGGFANPVKGARVLLDALPALHAACPDVRLTLAGPGSPPGGASPAGSRWLGWLDAAAKQRELANAAVVVVPSTSEGLPIVVLEAMAHGKAIVATRVGAIPDVLRDGLEGVLVEPSAPAQLADALRALTRDPERQRRLGDAAHRRAADFTPERVAEQVDAVYRGLLAEDRRR